MIFSRHKTNSSCLFQPKINSIPIEQKSTARFLGVIVDDMLSWTQHIHAIKSKMSRYMGTMYKLKNVLPQVARLTIFHSFIQSHLNYCSLVWGLSVKSNIGVLFRAQKKGIRLVMPGFVNYFYRDGETAAHTKTTFTKHKILTVQSIIVKNILLFMYKLHNFTLLLPCSIRDTIPENAPTTGSTYETCTDWLAEQNYYNIHFGIPVIQSRY